MADTEDQHAAKRRKVREKVPFQPGFLKRIKVWNFTTYSYTEFVLSPTLNMIIGPNGSGKSTLVAAICIGLAGKIDLIKRKNLKSMIKTGHDRAVVEITMENFPGKPPLVIKRDFSAKDSVWSVNGKKSTESAVRSLREKFNIQLDNLCHFLPQERVAEFAGMSPEKLLLETERTLKNGHLLTLHEDLIVKDSVSQEYSVNIDSLKKRLEHLYSQRSKLEEEVQKLQEYDRKVKEIETHKTMLPYARYNDLKKKRTELKEQLDEARRRYMSFDKNFDPLRKNISHLKRDIEGQKTKHQDTAKERDDVLKKIDEYKREVTKIQDTISDSLASLKSYRAKSESKKRELDEVRRELANLNNQLETIERVDKDQLEVLNTKYAEARARLRETEEKHREENNQTTDLRADLNNLTRNMQREESKLQGNDKLELLTSEAARGKSYRLRDESFKAHRKLRNMSNSNLTYFEAPIISCNVTDKSIAPAMEKIIDNNTLFAFTTTTGEAYDRLSRFSKDTKLNIPLRKVDDNEVPRVRYSKQELRNFGFDGYLSDFITGPKEVLQMLYNTAKIHTIPVTRNQLSPQQVDNLTKSSDAPFKKFVAGDTLFNIRTSKYGSRQVYYESEKFGKSQFFAVSGISEQDKQRINSNVERFNREIAEKREVYQNHKAQIEQYTSDVRTIRYEMSEIKSDQQKIQKMMSEVTNLEAKISSKKDKEHKLEEDSNKDYSRRVRHYEHKIAELYGTLAQKSMELSQQHVTLSDIQIKYKFQELELTILRNKLASANELIESLESIKNELASDVKKYKEEYDKIKESPEYREYRKKHDSLTEEQRLEIATFAKPYLDTDTFTEHAIRTKIHHLDEELSVMSMGDQGSVTSLRNIVQDIEMAETDLPKLESNKRDLDERIKSISAEWERDLSKFVEKISAAFSRRFSKVASEGRVDLAKADRFKDWKLQILVKFRHESELKVLDHQSQSGGERAVSTIFYIMSLQGLSDAPFRIVDEINQGMDPRNEQMAHRYLVHTACQNNKSQYFLVTPKLLTGLYYHPDMVVHCIFTGPFIEENNDQREHGFLDYVNTLVPV
ncbi:SMC5 [Candida metapsilosis]|uniref:Structural maintenance of chromosomes protein 5 n=1 Tax=Candida metapsilosis TaxID=273372 RepID=A0A8H7ZI74_9ASCO|nr:SMC5 [Candida metapsilosis]